MKPAASRNRECDVGQSLPQTELAVRIMAEVPMRKSCLDAIFRNCAGVDFRFAKFAELDGG